MSLETRIPIDILVSTRTGKMFRLEVRTAGEERIYGSKRSQFGENHEWQIGIVI